MSYSNDGAMSPADYAAITNNSGWGNGGFETWIVLFLIIAMCGWGNGFGGFGGNGRGTVADGYTLNSDFATIQRQLSDGFGGVEKGIDTIRNGLCDGFYTEAQLVNGVNMNIMNGVNGIQTQIADCCCRTQQGIKDTQYAVATTGAGITAAIKDCCCDNDKNFMQSRFDAAQAECATLQAIDKLGDRIVDYMSNQRAADMRDEIQALRLAASQQAQNNYLVSRLSPPVPVPAYQVPNPYYYGGCGGCCNG